MTTFKLLRKSLHKFGKATWVNWNHRPFYESSRSKFCLVSPSIGKDSCTIGIKVQWHYCREELVEEFYWVNEKLRNEPICLALTKFNSVNVEKGIRVLNYFERKAGWDETFVVPTNDDKMGIDLVVGSRKWMTSGLHLSLFILLLRIFSNNPIRKNESALSYLARLNKPTKRGVDIKTWKGLCKAHEDIIPLFMKHLPIFKRATNYEELKEDGRGEETISYCIKWALKQNKEGASFKEDAWYRTDCTAHTVNAIARLLKRYEGKRVEL